MLMHIHHTCLCLHEYLLKHFADFVLITLGPTQCASIHESMRMYWIFWFLHTLFLNISAFLASFLASFFISYFCINRSSSIAIRWPKNAHGKYPKAVNACRVEAHAHAHLWRGRYAHAHSHSLILYVCYAVSYVPRRLFFLRYVYATLPPCVQSK